MTAAEADPSRPQTNVSRSRPTARGRLRARLVGFAAAIGVCLGAFTLPASAQAADFNMWISSGFDPWLDIGGSHAVIAVEVQSTFQPGSGPKDVVVSAELNRLDGLAVVDVEEGQCFRSAAAQATCQGMTANEQRQIRFVVAPAEQSDLPEGETKSGTFKVKADGTKHETSVNVRGHAQAGPKSVTEVAGQVTSNAEPVADAKVVLTDGEGTDHQTSTDASGAFKFAGSDDGTYIAPGTLTLTVSKEGFEDHSTEFNVSEGTGFTQNLTLTPVQDEAEETTEAPPTTEAASEEPSPAAEEDEGGISGTLLFLIIVGALLVVGGIVGIVFLLRGGKDDEQDEGESFPTEGPPDHTPTAAQVGSPGVYQAGPAPGAEAPTMIHQGPLVGDREVGAYGAPTTAFGPAYGSGDDATQIMPQAGAGAPPPPAPSPPAVGPNDTQILPTLKKPPGAGSDATQIMPQANLGSRPPSQPPSPFADPAATRPHPGPTPPPTPSAPPARDPYAPPPSPSPHAGSQPPSPYQSPRRDPYAPPPSSAPQPPEPYTPAPTQAMPQGGFGSQPPASPYAEQQEEDDRQGSSHYRRDDERGSWGEWDDRPRSW